eukprot:1153623-Pelagomonas_calceolata.AAC.2
MAHEASVTDQRQHEKNEHNTQLQRMVAEMQVGATVAAMQVDTMVAVMVAEMIMGAAAIVTDIPPFTRPAIVSNSQQ